MKTKRKTAKETVASGERDSTYFLKLVLYVILGSLWLRFDPAIAGIGAVPLGLLIGLVFASHDHFAIDRKIEYAVLIVMTIASYWLPVGIVL